MILETKYDIGQKVWTVTESRSAIYAPCETCKGTGKVAMTTGRQLPCPDCQSFQAPVGQKCVGSEVHWEISAEGHIGKVQVEQYGDDRPSYIHKHRQVTYMLDSTGIGSGGLYYEPDVFPSREEAQAECDRQNALIAEASND
jgi:hypothetical protein